MKRVNIFFEDSEFKKLKEKKGELSWHDFVLTLINKEEK